MIILRFLFILCLIVFSGTCFAQIVMVNDTAHRYVVFGNKKMRIIVDYNHKANISTMLLNGEQVIGDTAGGYTAITTTRAAYSSLHLKTDPVAKIIGKAVIVTGIVYGDDNCSVNETWTFRTTPESIDWKIDRTLSKPIMAEEMASPVFKFKSIATWDGAYQGYGGLAWFYLFNKKSDTYGVHTNRSEFWNSKTGNGLSVAVNAPGSETAMSYSRTTEDQLAYRIAVTPGDMLARFDSGTNRRRYLREKTDVWAAFQAPAGTTSQNISLSYFEFNERYGRGQFAGINGAAVSAVLNTIARIGVIDKQHFGGNSWNTPYGPICLHEQYIAQLGLGINDPDYLNGYRDCLDFYRDNAIKPDGRVWPRWAYSNEDIMPGEVTAKGFYEAQWGYLLDANPDLVTNVAELYDQTGDSAWVRSHRLSCEKALDWICKRDSNHNGLVEMISDSHLQNQSSDWIDIIWASYENAFVNAKLYHALVLWAAIEKRLGDKRKAGYYALFAKKLKTSFNKPIAEGGFWDEKDTCYIHWREKDGSIHGNNMVTPVNFMAIAYGICNNKDRKKAILDKIETQMQKQKLFFWPLCLYSYAPGEGKDWQWPFPRYENGDIFLSWGSLGVAAYASYKPEIALQYVKNVLAQYAKDGLAFQRYGREKQDGLGDDILAGNSLSVVGLYQAIYGINPLYNRFYLNPHLTKELDGTRLKYNFREKKLTVSLDMNHYSVSDDRFTISAKKDFGFYSLNNEVEYFDGANPNAAIKVETAPNASLVLDIRTCSTGRNNWYQSSKDQAVHNLVYHFYDLSPNSTYALLANDKLITRIKTGADGSLQFDYTTSLDTSLSLVRISARPPTHPK